MRQVLFEVSLQSPFTSPKISSQLLRTPPFGDAPLMPSTRPSTFLASILASVLASCTATLLIFAALAQAQEAVAPAEAKETETPAPIPIGSVAIEAATLDNFLRSVESELVLVPELEKMIEELPEADAEVLAFTRHTENRLEGGYDRGDLDSFDAKWRSFAKDFDSWAQVLKIRLTSLDEHRSQLVHRSGIWEATAASAREVNAPAELRSQISRVQSSLKTAAVALRKNRDQALGLQKRVIALRERVNAGLDALVGARSEVLSHITRRNDPPLWAIAQSDLNLAQQDFVAAFEGSRESIAGYAHRES
jgi:hypothetical protein